MLPLVCLLLIIAVTRCQQRASNGCPFNSMCTCRWSTPSSVNYGYALGVDGSLAGISDIVCLQVPLARLPELPRGRVAQVDVAGSGLGALEAEPLSTARIDSLRLMSNNIKHIDDRAFSSMYNTLASLDLSDNDLDAIPFNALRDLRDLQWLNLNGNEIRSVYGDWSHMRDSLTSLLMADNDVSDLTNIDVDSQEFASLNELEVLSIVNLDGNRLSHIDKRAFPRSLQTLRLSHNLLKEFPVDVFEYMHRLQWVYVRGNHIQHVPQLLRVVHRTTASNILTLEKLDFGENELKYLPTKSLFNNGSFLRVRDLSLDFNRLETLPAEAFRGLKVGRILLNYNHINAIHTKAFVGVENTLEYVDFEHNKLVEVPSALSKLKFLKYLYLPSNMITEIQQHAFNSFGNSLRALSLSGNWLTKIPSEALASCTKLSHLNVGYNQIFEVKEEDFQNWAYSLDTLLLRSNRISYLDEGVFNATSQLRELSLSFNPLNYIHPNVFKQISETLQSLEISFALTEENFPQELLLPLNNLLWLAMDNNNIDYIEPNSLDSLSQLEYLNLESNRISHIDSKLFKSDIHGKLTDLRLSNNNLQIIDSKTFHSLRNIQSISLHDNSITTLKSNSFSNLTNLVKLIISNNQLKEIQPGAFTNLPLLTKLDLQNNKLFTFSFDTMRNVTSTQYPLSLNLSSNNLFEIFPSEEVMNIRSIDVNHNNLQSPPKLILDKLSSTIRRLYLSYNKIEALELEAFGPLEELEVLTLCRNNIAAIKKHAFVGLDSLQVLDISANEIEQLHVGQFSYLQQLRVLDMSNNRLHYLPKDIFRNTKIERLDLSSNGFTVMPSTVLNDIGITLKNLKINNNNIEHIDSTMFLATPYLMSLDLSHNRLNLLPDNVFTSIGNLQKLDLGSNPLRANFKELFHYAQSLRDLSLSNIGMKSAPSLPLPNLIKLNLTGNSIEEITRYSMKGLAKLRHLYLRNNNLKSVPSHVWSHLPVLKTLDLSNNPIKELTTKCFVGLSELQHLNLHSLNQLEHIDADALSPLKILASITLQTSKFELRTILSNVTSLKKISLEIKEPSLTNQLHGILNRRIKDIEIWGHSLKSIAKDAFSGLENNAELLLSIRYTQIEELPIGMVATFNRIPHLILDLRDNMLMSLTPDVFYTNMTTWESVGTKLISGGLLLSGNPWVCDCRLVWLSHWLRRWLRESLQAHTMDADTAQALHDKARQALCTHPDTGVVASVVQLRPEQLSCHASALSNGCVVWHVNNCDLLASRTILLLAIISVHLYIR